MAGSTCKLRIRRIVNKMTINNVVSGSRDICKLFEDGTFPRADVVDVLGEELINAFCNTHDCTQVVLCSFAGVVRGMQLLHGSGTGTTVVQGVVDMLRRSLSQNNDVAAANCGGFLSFLYLLGGLTNSFIADLISSCAAEFDETGIACCLSVLRCCGSRIVSEIPAELNRVVKSLEGKERSKRADALLSVCKDIARGVIKSDTMSPHLGVAEGLVELIGDSDKHTLRRRLATQNVSNVCWNSLFPVKVETEVVPNDAERKRKRIESVRSQEKAVAGQRFASEAKREVFSCIMGSTDDVECFHALVNRDPSFAQISETLAVLLQCCVQESLPNSFYACVVQRLVCSKKSFKSALQFAIWDRFKAIRIDQADVTGFLNLSALLTDLFESDVFDLMLLRGLDLNETSKTIGLFTRILLLRLLVCLSSERLTSLFFNLGNNRKSDDTLRRCLSTFIERYFLDEKEAGRWMPHVFEVVAEGTVFADKSNAPQFVRRIEGVSKALKFGQ